MEEERSAGAIVFYRAEKLLFLILHYSKGHWDFPKGHVEKGETDIAAMLRELKEETGIEDAKIVPKFRETINYFFTENGRKIKKQVVFFLVESGTNNVKLSHEHTDYAWLPYAEAMKKVTFNNARDVLKKAYEFLKQSSLSAFDCKHQ